MGNRMDGMRSVPVFTNVSHFPGHAVYTERLEDPDELSFWQQRALDLRITTMAPPTKPYWNTTMVTAWVAVIVGIITVLSAVVGLWYFTDQAAEKRGLERGLQQAEQQQLKDRLEKAEDELRRTKDLKLIQSGQQAGHEEKKK